MLYKSKKYVLICGALLCTSNLLLGVIEASEFGLQQGGVREHESELTSPAVDTSVEGQTSGEDALDEMQKVCQVTQINREDWTNRLNQFVETGGRQIGIGEIVKELDEAFPYLGFRLAFEIHEKGDNCDILTDIRKFTTPYGSQETIRMQGRFADGSYILKDKETMRTAYKNKNRHVESESLAGERIRQAFVQKILEVKEKEPQKSFDDILGQITKKFQFLKFLVAPIDCGLYIVSKEVLEHTPLMDIIYVTEDAILKGAGIDNYRPWPEEIHEGTAEQRINMAQDLVAIVKFLHNIGIGKIDTHRGNFLISESNYNEVYLIDFDQCDFFKTAEAKGQSECGEDDEESDANPHLPFIQNKNDWLEYYKGRLIEDNWNKDIWKLKRGDYERLRMMLIEYLFYPENGRNLQLNTCTERIVDTIETLRSEDTHFKYEENEIEEIKKILLAED